MMTDVFPIQKADFDQILVDLKDFWGDRHYDVISLHHPMFFFEFADAAFVIKNENKVLAYLLGMVLPDKELAYIHMVGCRDSHKRKGFAGKLYRHFLSVSKQRGCTTAKAITTVKNVSSIEFHKSLGFHLLGDPGTEGIPLVKNYRGPGEDRVVFQLLL